MQIRGNRLVLLALLLPRLLLAQASIRDPGQGLPAGGSFQTIDIGTPQRVQARDRWVAEVLSDGGARPVSGRKPVLYLLGGGSGSGKSTVKERLLGDGTVRGRTVQIDADAIKQKIPEYRRMIDSGDRRAAATVHEESSLLAKKALSEAMNRHLDVTLDATLSNPSSAMRTIERARRSGYDIHLIGVTAPEGTALARVAARARQTGRQVPTDVVLESHRGFSQGFPRIAAAVDQVHLYDTGGAASGPPKLIARKSRSGSLEILDGEAYSAFNRKAVANTDAARIQKPDGGAASRSLRLPDTAGAASPGGDPRRLTAVVGQRAPSLSPGGIRLLGQSSTSGARDVPAAPRSRAGVVSTAGRVLKSGALGAVLGTAVTFGTDLGKSRSLGHALGSITNPSFLKSMAGSTLGAAAGELLAMKTLGSVGGVYARAGRILIPALTSFLGGTLAGGPIGGSLKSAAVEALGATAGAAALSFVPVVGPILGSIVGQHMGAAIVKSRQKDP